MRTIALSGAALAAILGVALVAGLGLLPARGSAGPLGDQALGVDALLAAGERTAAVEAARTLLDTLWSEVGLIGFTQAALVAEPARGFGLYTPRPDARYTAGEPVLIYAEPYGYGFGDLGNGLWNIGFDVDLMVLGPDGATLGDVPGVTELSLDSRHRNKEFQASLTFTLGGIPPGIYTLRTTMRDRNSDRWGSFDLAIEILP